MQRHSILWWLQIVLLNVSFWILFTIVSILYGSAAVLCLTMVHYTLRNRRLTKRLIRRAISYYGAMVDRCGWPFIRVRYVDCAPDEKPPFVFAVNHRSSSDGFLMGLLPVELVQVLNIWPAHTPVIGPLARAGEYLRVREMPFDEFLEAGSRLISVGCSVVVFPEGTRSGSRTLGPFHGAGFRLAQRCGVKIAPIAIAGNERMPPRGSLLLRPGRVTVTKLPSITPEQYAGISPYQLKNLAREKIRTHLDAIEQSGTN